MKLFADWLERKSARSVLPLEILATVGYEYERVVGPRSIYGRVSIRVSSCATLEFESRVKWPDGDNYDQMVLDGILDALSGWGYRFVVARFELLEIGWHPVYSSPIGYYRAAKRAIRSLLAEVGDRFDSY
jgi:hypothetical protein